MLGAAGAARLDDDERREDEQRVPQNALRPSAGTNWLAALHAGTDTWVARRPNVNRLRQPGCEHQYQECDQNRCIAWHVEERKHIARADTRPRSVPDDLREIAAFARIECSCEVIANRRDEHPEQGTARGSDDQVYRLRAGRMPGRTRLWVVDKPSAAIEMIDHPRLVRGLHTAAREHEGETGTVIGTRTRYS